MMSIAKNHGQLGYVQRLVEFLRLKCRYMNDSRSYRTESTWKLLGRNDVKGIEDERYSTEVSWAG